MACRLTRRHRDGRVRGRESRLPPRARDVLLGPGVEVVTVPIDLAEGGTGTTDPAIAAGVAGRRRRLPGRGPAELLRPARADARARRCRARGRRAVRRRRRADLARRARGARRVRRRHRRRRGPAARHPGQLRRPVRRAHGGADGVGAADARPAGGRHARRARAARATCSPSRRGSSTSAARRRRATSARTRRSWRSPPPTYLTAVGPAGLREVAELSMIQARHLVAALEGAGLASAALRRDVLRRGRDGHPRCGPPPRGTRRATGSWPGTSPSATIRRCATRCCSRPPSSPPMTTSPGSSTALEATR